MSFNQPQHGFPSHSQQQVFLPLLSRPVSNPFLCQPTTLSMPDFSLIQSFQALQKLQENQIKANVSYDITSSEPTKRVRLTQQDYTNANQGLFIPTPKKQTQNIMQNEDLIQASQTLEMIKRKQMEEQINQKMMQQYRIRQQLLQQLGYQQSDYVFQQHMMKVAQDMIPKNFNNISNQEKLLFDKIPEVKETQKIKLPKSPFEPKIMEQEWCDTFVKSKVEDSSIKLEELERTSGTSGGNSEDEVAQINNLEKQIQNKLKEKTKVKKAPAKPKQPRAKKIQHFDYYQTPMKEKTESRRKNRWQVQAEKELQESAATQENVVNESVKAQQEEANIDYEYFQSITITNDPAKVGEERAAKGFVVINRDNKDALLVNDVKETGVGARYQAMIPELNKRNTRRKGPEQLWNPDMIYKDKVNEYCENLKKILKCDHINEERALKLLTRKNYQSDKVETNISKNEKFYSGFLVVHDVKKISAAVEENVSQEGQTM